MNWEPDWLPPLVRLDEFEGDWQKYIDAVFAVFYSDFVESRPIFRGLPVAVRKHPLIKGKEVAFWHCVSTGEREEDRIPDLRRCERIGWVRAIIAHADHPSVQVWSARKSGTTAHTFGSTRST